MEAMHAIGIRFAGNNTEEKHLVARMEGCCDVDVAAAAVAVEEAIGSD